MSSKNPPIVETTANPAHNLPRDLYVALAAGAKHAGLRLVGHVPSPVGLAGLLEVNGQSGIEHGEELLPFFRGDDTTGLAEAARALARSATWNSGSGCCARVPGCPGRN